MSHSSQPVEAANVTTRSRRLHSPIWGWIAIFGIISASAAYIVVGTWSEVGTDSNWTFRTWPTLQRHIMEAIVTVWFAFLGGCFGSFLNVVI